MTGLLSQPYKALCILNLEGDIENILIFCPGQAFFKALVDTTQEVAMHVFIYPPATAMNGFVS